MAKMNPGERWKCISKKASSGIYMDDYLFLSVDINATYKKFRIYCINALNLRTRELEKLEITGSSPETYGELQYWRRIDDTDG